MKYAVAVVVAITLAFGLAANAPASLVGDEVLVEYIVRDVSYPQIVTDGGYATVVEGMATPEIEISYAYDIYFDADRVQIDFMTDNFFEGSSLFSGIQISDLNDTENPDWIILGVEIQTDWQDWSNDRLVFGEDGQSIGFNFEGLTTPIGQNLTAIFEFGPNPIPIPATMLLFVTGLIGFMAFRKLKR